MKTSVPVMMQMALRSLRSLIENVNVSQMLWKIQFVNKIVRIRRGRIKDLRKKGVGPYGRGKDKARLRKTILTGERQIYISSLGCLGGQRLTDHHASECGAYTRESVTVATA